MVCLVEQLSLLRGKGFVPSLSLPSLRSFLLPQERERHTNRTVDICFGAGLFGQDKEDWKDLAGQRGVAGEQPSWALEWSMMCEFSLEGN